MEETDIRIAEVKRDAYEFRRDIVVGAENPRTGKTVAEKVLKYMEDKLTQKDMQINKLLMKNQAYKVAIKKAEQQLKSKAETGDDLQYIDFHQLQIENSQFVKRIEEANQELIELKRRAGRTVKILNNMKKRLSSLTAEAKFLQDEIKDRRSMLAKTEKDICKVVEEKEAARKEHKKLRAQSRQSPEMPQVVDYVSQKAEAYELEAQKRNWERKVELAETAAKRIRQAVKNGTQLSGSQFMEMVRRPTSLGLAAAQACWPKLTAEVLRLWSWSTRLKTRALAPRSHLLLHMLRILKVLLQSATQLEDARCKY
ncbi:Ccdc113 [Symbiodinium sp. CCMP2592]|nr:Ccdc113 [Symbiodinium sp. CCMP2592]